MHDCQHRIAVKIVTKERMLITGVARVQTIIESFADRKTRELQIFMLHVNYGLQISIHFPFHFHLFISTIFAVQ